MVCRCTWLSIFCLVAACDAACGQGIAVQLPRCSYFTVKTTVSVPDRGSAYLGGVNRAASGVNQFGAPLVPFGNRAAGSERSASNAWVSATIHDFEAMDRYLLSQPTASYPNGLLSSTPSRAGKGAGAAMARDVAAECPAASVAELRARRLEEAEARGKEFREFFDGGRAAEAAGKANVAKIYYQMAARRADGPLKAEILARLDLLGSAAPTAKIAQNGP
jgi:hypothetical protein